MPCEQCATALQAKEAAERENNSAVEDCRKALAELDAIEGALDDAYAGEDWGDIVPAILKLADRAKEAEAHRQQDLAHLGRQNENVRLLKERAEAFEAQEAWLLELLKKALPWVMHGGASRERLDVINAIRAALSTPGPNTTKESS